MITATEVDYEAWLAGEVEVPCELWEFGILPCGSPAGFVAYARCSKCCDPPEQRFVCERHRKMLGSALVGHGPGCDDIPVTVTWIERIKR